jgi:thiamine monophosphate kinase
MQIYALVLTVYFGNSTDSDMAEVLNYVKALSTDMEAQKARFQRILQYQQVFQVIIAHNVSDIFEF